jgi:hypothetical protein
LAIGATAILYFGTAAHFILVGLSLAQHWRGCGTIGTPAGK